MKASVHKSQIKGKVEAPPSKSLTHRAVILASIIPKPSTIHNPLLCEDTKATIEACNKIGARIEVGDEITIHGTSKPTPAGTIDVNNSGTTLRLMAGVCSLARGQTTITGDASLLKRPMLPLLNSLEHLGAKTGSQNGMPPVTISGPLKGGRTEITGDVSQFVSSLLIAGLRSENGIEITLSTPLKSRPYIDLTIDTIKKAGGRVEVAENILTVAPNPLKPLNLSIEPDFSSAAFLLAAGAIAGEVTVSVNLDSLQGDKKILQILEEMGAEVEIGDGCVTVRKAPLIAITADLCDTPDLLPIVSVLMALAEGKSRIVNAEHTRKKECDRIAVMTEELNKLGAKVSETPDGLEIKGVQKLNGSADSHGDHRIAMALIIAGLSGNVQVSGIECTDVSFPGFIETLTALGVEVENG